MSKVGRDARSRAEAPRTTSTTAYCKKCCGQTLQTERRWEAGPYEMREQSCLACGSTTAQMRTPRRLKQVKQRRHDLVKAKQRLHRIDRRL